MTTPTLYPIGTPVEILIQGNPVRGTVYNYYTSGDTIDYAIRIIEDFAVGEFQVLSSASVRVAHHLVSKKGVV